MSEYVLGIIKDVVLGIIKWIVIGVVNCSYWIFLLCALVCLILYIAGLKKAGKYVPISFIAYLFLQAIKGAIM
ncbi:hypothetical protein [Clostridium hydrogeniformans]|uniref:hypothetical protein n=1 Tax=Clostridium hydrogeniformans TaxID=349933 RepID=UPI000482E136|nr:hypothetical protein [Clostridium hydrogeniformans]